MYLTRMKQRKNGLVLGVFGVFIQLNIFQQSGIKVKILAENVVTLTALHMVKLHQNLYKLHQNVYKLIHYWHEDYYSFCYSYSMIIVCY